MDGKNSYTEENYLKAIYALSVQYPKGVPTTAIANHISTKASSVTDMIKKLSEKKLIDYKKYNGVSLTKDGKDIAVSIIRKHRLWEVFLVEKLNFKWDEVHPIAEQLEHINSVELTNRLDDFLDNPKYDPHGDPIPDEQGNINDNRSMRELSDMTQGDRGVIAGVNDTSAEFLQYLDNQNLVLGTSLVVLNKFEYDGSVLLKIKDKEITISRKVAENICVKTA
jgi:DtxR family transcriptional regulator, Mn-dependent transcriptional regulator